MKGKKIGDRRDGRRIRDVDGLHVIMMHLMPRRTEAEVYLQYTVDVTELLKYIDQKNLDHPEYKTTVFHCIIAAVARTVKMRPQLNRFICGRHLYERDDITLSFVAKRKFADHSEESLMVLTAKDEMNLDYVSHKIVGDVKEMRSREKAAGIDGTVDLVAKLPHPIAKAFFGLLQWLSSHGKVPSVLTDGDTNHTSILLSNLGSIGCDCCYHHLNRYGTNSILITVGVIHKVPLVNENGEIEMRDVVNLGLTADERIADGFYFARSMKIADHILNHPELLEIPLKEEIDYAC